MRNNGHHDSCENNDPADCETLIIFQNGMRASWCPCVPSSSRPISYQAQTLTDQPRGDRREVGAEERKADGLEEFGEKRFGKRYKKQKLAISRKNSVSS